jgi:mannose-1-phosphate guanylyltransferase
MAELWPPDETGNACQDGPVLAIEAQGNLVSAQGRLAALLGVSGLVAVVTDDVLLIMPKERSQEVKRFVEMLKERGQDQLI